MQCIAICSVHPPQHTTQPLQNPTPTRTSSQSEPSAFWSSATPARTTRSMGSRFIALMDDGSSSPDEVDAPLPVHSNPLQLDMPSSPDDRPPLQLEDPIFWTDLEMTGLDPAQHTILEIAIIVSDGTLNTLIEGPSLCIHHDEATLTSMNAWSTEQHQKSGLTQRCRESAVSLADAEEVMRAFIEQHCRGRPAVLGGASVYVDKQFLDARCSSLRPLLSHRTIDVSTIRELARRWQPRTARNAPKGVPSHRALDDIKYSIQELRYFRDACWKPMEPHSQRRHRATKRSDATTVKRPTESSR